MSVISFSKKVPDTKFHVICVHSKNKDSVLSDLLKSLVKSHAFNAKKDETLLHQTSNETTLILGMGEPKFEYEWEEIGAKIYDNTKKWPEGIISITMPGVTGALQIAGVASGIDLKSWKFDKYKTKKEEDKEKDHKYAFVCENELEVLQKYKNFESINSGNKLTRDLVSEPANVLFPESYANRIKTELKDFPNLNIKILNENKMKDLKMNSLLAVGKGSDQESQLVVLEYNPPNAKNKNPLIFVGKGVTFDTGGISIKPAAKMDEMKGDMAGSATVCGLLKTLSMRNSNAHAIGILGLVENMCSSKSYRPGDIVKAASGTTIEVLNTDAEGRMVLADCLWYAQKFYNPEVIIDLATLTGAIVVALGLEYAGVFTESIDLYKNLEDASYETDEGIWRMPLCKSFNKDIESDVADIKNIGGGRGAGSATAAHFLKRFIKKENEKKWCHMDIAGVSDDNRDRTLFKKGARGFGVRLLNKFVEKNYE